MKKSKKSKRHKHKSRKDSKHSHKSDSSRRSRRPAPSLSHRSRSRSPLDGHNYRSSQHRHSDSDTDFTDSSSSSSSRSSSSNSQSSETRSAKYVRKHSHRKRDKAQDQDFTSTNSNLFGHDHIKRKKYSSGSSSNTTVTDYESHTDQSSITANQKESRATFNVHANQTRCRNLSQDLSHERIIPKNKSKQTTVCKSKADGRTISSIWSKGMKCKDDSEKCDKVNLNILPMNILVEFKDEKYPFILLTDSFIDFIYDLESTVGEKINSHDCQFQYITGFAGKEYAVTIHSQITFNAFMRYMNTVKQDLVLVKVSKVTVSTQTVQSIETIENSSLHHTNEVESKKSEDLSSTGMLELSQPSQNESDNIDLKSATGKEAIHYLDCREWKPDYIKKFDKLKPTRERAIRELIGKLEPRSCEICPSKHIIQTFRNFVDDDVKEKIKMLFTKVDLNLFSKKRNAVMQVYGNSLLLINPLYAQCALCGNVVSLGHMNEIFIKGDKLVHHLTHLFIAKNLMLHYEVS